MITLTNIDWQTLLTSSNRPFLFWESIGPYYISAGVIMRCSYYADMNHPNC